MSFVLSHKNVFDYLVERKILTSEMEAQSQIERKYAKNFNLLVSLPDNRKILVKQEPRNREGKTAGEFQREWRIQEFMETFPELSQMKLWLSEKIDFDAENSIIVFNYLDNYRDLIDFYGKENIFPLLIAENIGTILAKIHRLTFENQVYQDFLTNKQNQSVNTSHLVRKLERIGPEIFGLVPGDGLKFFALYQRYDSLGKAIAELGDSITPCCLTHNDLKLNNILLSNDWQEVESALVSGEKSENIIRLIDWERCGCGDPAFDLGSLIGSYLHIWLSSLITSKAMTIDESLRMATTPLEIIQPSLGAIATSYLDNFPEITHRRPDFWKRVVQFAGWNLIGSIQSTLQYQKSFDNTGICMLQVAKSLLCRAEQSMTTIINRLPVTSS
ncbi:MAG: phosphotransferase [Rivularia sp. (in: cyanobacteria)]